MTLLGSIDVASVTLRAGFSPDVSLSKSEIQGYAVHIRLCPSQNNDIAS